MSVAQSEQNYVGRVATALASLRMDRIEALVDELVRAQASGAYVYIVGNGGSATTASHMATDLGVGSQRVSMDLRALSLADNVGVLSATGNDRSFEHVFSAQVELLGRAGDVLVAISASGNSPNLIAAAHAAKARSMTVVALTGFTGGALAQISDISVHVETAVGDYGPAEDAHLVMNHMVAELLRTRLGCARDLENVHG